MGATHCLYVDDTFSNEPAYKFVVNNGRDIFAQYYDGTEVFALMSDGYIRTTSGWKYRMIQIHLGDTLAANNDFTYPLLRTKHDITLVSAHLGVDTTLGDDAVNFETWYLEQSGSDTDIATKTTVLDWTKHVPQSMGTLDTAAKKIAAGATLSLRAVQTASGLAMSGLVITIVYTIDAAKSTPGTSTDNLIRIMSGEGTASVIGADITDRDFLVVEEGDKETFRLDIAGKQHGDAPDQYHYQVINVGDLADGDTKECGIMLAYAAIQIEKIWVGVDTTIAVSTNDNYWQMKFTDGTNTIADFFIAGPYGNAAGLTKGLLYDVGAINPAHSKIAASGKLVLQPTEPGAGVDVSGLTVVVAYKKLA